MGIWNELDAIPMMIGSALRLKAVPEMRDETDFCSWIPVDTAAAAILDLYGVWGPRIPTQRGREDVAMVYNLVSPHTFSWTTELLPHLETAGLVFERTSFAAWIERLRDIIDQAEEVKYSSTLLHHPYLKPVDFWSKNLVAAEKKAKAGGARLGTMFDTTRARKDSVALRHYPQIMESGFI